MAVTWTTRNGWAQRRYPQHPSTPRHAATAVLVPPRMAKAESTPEGSTKSRKRKEVRAPAPFPSSSQAKGADDRPRRLPQMSTARGRDGGRTQRGVGASRASFCARHGPGLCTVLPCVCKTYCCVLLASASSGPVLRGMIPLQNFRKEKNRPPLGT
jgi:hypothetical protein